MLHAHVELIDPVAGNRRFVASNLRGHALTIDDADGNTAPKPIELVLMALAGCTAFDVISILRKKRHVIISYSVEASAEQAATVPNVFTKIDVCHVVEGKTVTEGELRSVIELSERKYCSVGAMLSKAVEIKTTFRLNGCLHTVEEQDEKAIA